MGLAPILCVHTFIYIFISIPFHSFLAYWPCLHIFYMHFYIFGGNAFRCVVAAFTCLSLLCFCTFTFKSHSNHLCSVKSYTHVPFTYSFCTTYLVQTYKQCVSVHVRVRVHVVCVWGGCASLTAAVRGLRPVAVLEQINNKQ